MEEFAKGNGQETTSQERLRLIKEERRKQHEQRLERSPMCTVGLLNEDSDTLKRFSKYRRSDRERLRKDAAEVISSPRSLRTELERETVISDTTDILPRVELSKEHLWNVSPLYSSASSSTTPDPCESLPQDSVKSNATQKKVNLSEFRTYASTSTLTSSLSLDHNKGVLKKPSIPPILRSATEPTPIIASDDEPVSFKKPSILKKKDDSPYAGNAGIGSSAGGSGQCASVSFGLPESKSLLTRTKSIDSNLSCDTETGYWSGENSGGILKNRRQLFDGDLIDQSSILKLRRSSLGSSVLSSSGSEGGLQSILKRKLSYDSSYIMKEASSNEYSFSTHSLPACGCLSPEPKPILKKKSSSEDLEEIEPKPILKHRTSRDYHDISVDSERIKPCLKKSSSKSAEESNFPTSSSLNYSFPSSVSPSYNSSSSDGGTGSVSSGANKSILKKGGILKHTWREPSSSFNDIDNLRSVPPVESREDIYRCSSGKESFSDLQRARRSFCSESDINTQENHRTNQPLHVTELETRTNNAASPPCFQSENRSDDTALENGLASEDIERYPGGSEATPSISTRSHPHHSNNNSYSSSSALKNIEAVIEGKTCSVQEDNQAIASVFGPRKKQGKTRSDDSDWKKILDGQQQQQKREDGEEGEKIGDGPKFKYNWRRNSVGSTNNSSSNQQLFHDFVYGCLSKGEPSLVYGQGLKSELNSKSENDPCNHPLLLRGSSTNSSSGCCNEANAMSSSTIGRTDSHEDIIMSLSVAEKRSLFMQLEIEGKSEDSRKKQGGFSSNSSKASARSKRYTTQPVTTDEVEKAAKMMVQNQQVKSSSSTKTGATTSSPSVKNDDKTFESDNVNRELGDDDDDVISSLDSTAQEKINLRTDCKRGLISHKSVDNCYASSSSSSVNDHHPQPPRKGDEPFHEPDEDCNSATSSECKTKDTLESPLISLPPSGAASSRSRSRPYKESFVARFARVTEGFSNINKDDEDARGGNSRTGSKIPRTEEFKEEATASTTSVITTPTTSLSDRIRMFNTLSSVSQTEYKAATRKTVTSKRFNTQPIFPTTPKRLFEEYGNGAAPTPRDDTISSPMRKKKAPTATTSSATSTDEDNKSTVRDEEGHNENESECSQSLGAISADSHNPCSSQDVNSDQEFDPDTPSEARCSSPLGEMPERVLSGSEDSSSNDESNPDYLDPYQVSDPYSCVRRKVSKSSSANSMMMSAEADLNLFQKAKANRNSIAEKIAALQTNGEAGWKKRIAKINPDFSDAKDKGVQPQQQQPTDQNDNVELRRNNKDSSASVIANRLSQLESSQEKWKKRVGENDANIFTVQGRLEKAGKISRVVAESPVTPTAEHKVKGIKVLTPLRFRNTSETTSDTSPTSCSPNDGFSKPKNILNLTKAQPPVPKLQRNYSRSDTSSSGESSEEEKVTRSVTRNDNETFSSFFDPMLPGGKAGKAYSTTSSVQIDDSSFKAIQATTGRQLLGNRRNVKAPRNHSNAKNPVKSLALRLQDQSYVELSPQVREKEMKKRINVENLAKNAQLSVEALAGLASKEDFTAVKLKKAGNERNTKEFPHPMLIRIKGKRQVQTRLVPPEVESLSSGDNYILVTANKLYQFIGEYSNRLERAKIADVVSHIVQKKDLGCRIMSNTEVATIEEPLLCGGRDQAQFFQILGGESVPETDDLGDELDEAYESGIVTTNRIFEVDDTKEELVPLLESGGWKCPPRHSLLQDDKVLVFDFGSELYVWSGSKADPALKKTAYQLAKGLFDEGYNYEDIDPTWSPVGRSLQGSARPNWCFLKKINQHMEPILFIEKFFDWPDDSGRLIKVQKQRSSDGSMKEASYNFKACDIDQMLQDLEEVPEPSLELEGFDVGRGNEVRNSEDRRVFNITTLDVKAWNISEFSKCEVEATSLGQFYSEETCVIRWQFSVSQIGRDLKGNLSKHIGALGRERCTYFFWQGKNSKITEQGTSALMTVELDREKGPQIRVEQGREPPAFVNLFKGLMFVHLESKEAPLKDAKLYVAMGACEEEGHFIEVECQSSSLRTLGSFLLADFLKGRLYLWHGKLSNAATRKIASNAATKILETPHQYLNYHGSLRLIEVEEGDETHQFLSCINVPSKTKLTESYLSLRGQNPDDYTEVTCFGFSSLQGSFEATPLVSVKRRSGHPEAFPILQEELYSAQQPTLFLITRGSETWLWQGWTPQGDEENENATTGSGEIRWAAERKAAAETAVNFCRRKGTQGYVVLAGLEPTRFTNLFPYWKVMDEAREANLTEERTVGLIIPLEEEFDKFQNTRFYTLEELQERPEEVDQSKLETYLSDEDFENILKMDKEEFKKLQSWKQNELKKTVGLF